MATYYAATNGSPAGDGSIGNPWDLQTALNQPSAVQPGDTILVRGGTYVGNFTSSLAGTSALPIVVRGFPGERAILDGNTGATQAADLLVFGQYTWFQDLEFTDSSLVRVVSSTSSNGPRSSGVEDHAVGTKLIALVIHDTSGGIGDWSTGTNPSNTEVNGCIIYNVGWQGPDRGHGHGFYIQNQTGTKTFNNNIVFNSFGYGIHAYTEGGSINNLDFFSNDIFNAGSLATAGDDRQILIGGLVGADHPVLDGNSVYASGPNGQSIQLGYSVPDTNVTLTNNYTYSASGLSVYAGTTFLANSGNTFNAPLTPKPTVNQIFVRPITYVPGRAHIVIFNWQGLNSVSVDVSGTGLVSNQAYSVYDAQNLGGSPVASGIYVGSPISLPMTGTAVTQPIGNAPVAAVHTSSDYGAFVLIPGDVTPIPSTVSVSFFPNPVPVGQAATLGATVSPVGTVTFFDGTTALGTVQLANGTATLTTSGLAAGSHSLTAQYVPSSTPCTPMIGVVTPPPSATIFGPSMAPGHTATNDKGPVDLGVQFYADVPGSITAIRFHKAATNAGPHVVSLWSATGTLLARATSSTETASGWQQVLLDSPITLVPGTIYVASYHAPAGNYSYDHNVFTHRYDSGQLHVPVNGGVYIYASSPAFPVSSYAASNYGVDVVFQPS